MPYEEEASLADLVSDRLRELDLVIITIKKFRGWEDGSLG